MDVTISTIADSTAGLFITRCSRAYLENGLRELFKDDCNIWLVDGSNCTSKSGIFREFDSIVRFPPYFGNNWDAFHDCMHDLAWPGSAGREKCGNHVFIVTKAIQLKKLDKRDRKIILEIFQDLESSWNLSVKRGMYKFILCCLREQQEELLKMLWEAGFSYEYLVEEDNAPSNHRP